MNEEQLKLKREKFLQRANLGENKFHEAILNNNLKNITEIDKNISTNITNNTQKSTNNTNKDSKINTKNKIKTKRNNKIKIIANIILGILSSFFMNYLNIKNNLFLVFIFLLFSYNFILFKVTNRKVNIDISTNNRVSNIAIKIKEFVETHYYLLEVIDDISCFIIPFLITSSIIN